MDRTVYCSKANEAVANIDFEGELVHRDFCGNGHINDTFVAIFKKSDGSFNKYILQRINHEVFKNPQELMENVWGVTEYLKQEIAQQGGDPRRETLSVIPAKDGKSYYKDSIGCYWRGFHYIDDAGCYEFAETPEQFYESAVAFGTFQKMLAGYPAHTLHETIPDFHNTPVRLQALHNAIAADVKGRAGTVQNEINFVLERAQMASALTDMLARGELPLRVTHNDTKLNNVMIDNTTGRGLCVVDLDTVMPGLAVYDFGDSIRFGASSAAEDECDLSRVHMELPLFDCYTKGFLQACGDSMTQTEIDMLPMGAKVMTFECGIRFLTDYLQGDTYFKTDRENQNLDRCRTQFKLVADMEKKWNQMQEIVNTYRR